MVYQNIIVESRGNVGLVTLNRPQALNALNEALIAELNEALSAFEADGGIGCTVITGSEKAFAAGADVKEMAEKTYVEAYLARFLDGWTRLAETRKPVIAAVSGFCLGGGLELAMMCDFIIAAETARFALPEITLGIMPGAGGTQRLARAIGRHRAMLLLLTGDMLTAREAFEAGLVSAVSADGAVLDDALALAARIAAMPPLAVAEIKRVLHAGLEAPLDVALQLERRAAYLLFDTDDKREAMRAFLEKRKPSFSGR
jgi:enoyl-CoA hydratase